MNEREQIDRGWYYVVEPDDGRWAPEHARIVADDGRVLTRRLHGFPGRIDTDTTVDLPVATLLRAAGAAGRVAEARSAPDFDLRITLDAAGTPPRAAVDPDGRTHLWLDGPAVASAPSHHTVEALIAQLLGAATPARVRTPVGGLPDRPAPRALFFESLMNTDMPHNDVEISQGVLHMISPLKDSGTEVVLVNAKMPITGDTRPVWGIERLEAALRSSPIDLVAITLLEGYWEGVLRLIDTVRSLGCRAHIAVGGVMPTLAPEHVAAHLPEVSFVCRGAGEYFVPRLTQILGTTTVDDAFTDGQRRALLDLDGVLTLERAGGRPRLLSANCKRSVQVEELDRVKLDLSHVQARHLVGGMELSTSRGCIHKCSFCSILGRESYQARSAGGVFDVLRAYEGRFRELYGDRIPDNCYRVHISDDDFACDRERARTFFESLLETPFRLSSTQVSIADLCRKENGKLLAEPDHVLLDAIKAECFADHGRPIPKRDYFEDHRSRTWSSFLQIGVETYDDREIARLGKGYQRVHVRTIVAELARRRLHMDGYFILSNAETSAEDMVNVFSEVARLKLRFPEHFHMRFPVVPNLVSYFTSASHRRHVRRGRAHVMKLRGLAQVPGHAELDYPFVDHDEPEDVWVSRTVHEAIVTDEGMYTANLERMQALWTTWLADVSADHPDRARIRSLIRVMDDRRRGLVFEMLRQAWLQDDDGWPDARLDAQLALDVAERVLGARVGWFDTFKASLRDAQTRRLALAVDDATPGTVVDEALALLASTVAPRRVLHLLSPYALRAPDALIATLRQVRQAQPDVEVVLDGDGWAITPEVVTVLRAHDVDVTLVVRPGPQPRLDALVAAGVVPNVVLQVPLGDVGRVAATWDLLAHAGVRQVCVEPLPEPWTSEDAAALGRALFALAPAMTTGPVLMEAGALRSGHLGEVLVDRDGTIGRSDGLVPGVGLQASHHFGHLDDLTGVDRHAHDRLDGTRLPGVTRLSELERRVALPAKVLSSFVAWRRGRTAPTMADEAHV